MNFKNRFDYKIIKILVEYTSLRIFIVALTVFAGSFFLAEYFPIATPLLLFFSAFSLIFIFMFELLNEDDKFSIFLFKYGTEILITIVMINSLIISKYSKESVYEDYIKIQKIQMKDAIKVYFKYNDSYFVKTVDRIKYECVANPEDAYLVVKVKKSYLIKPISKEEVIVNTKKQITDKCVTLFQTQE